MKRKTAKLVVRAAEMIGAYGVARTTPELIDKVTQAQGHCELINQQLDLFTRFVYRETDNGLPLHILADGQIVGGVWTPWGSSGKSGLTRLERDVLRRHLLGLNEDRCALFY